jgi:DNA-binding Xre family transcriptional regulator
MPINLEVGGPMAKTYVPGDRPRMARLRSVAALEHAMRIRDINGRELARAAGTSAQTVSQLRTGHRLHVRADIARKLELALRVRPGLIFSVDPDGRPRPAAARPTRVA